MKNKLFLPLLAVIFAAAGAVASKPVFQSAWYRGSSGVTTGVINNTTKPCATSLVHQCTINGFDAYNSQDDAIAQNPSGLLKYN